MWIRGIRALAVIGMVACLGVYVLAQQPCDIQVQSILDAVNSLCLNDARDSVCYGNTQVQAQAQPGVNALKFDRPGDQASVAQIKSLQLSPMNLEQSTWGIARMRLTPSTARSAADDVILLLFGDVHLENQGELRPTFDFTVTANYDVRLRNFPSLNSTVIGWLRAGNQVTALGRMQDNSWVRVQKQPDGLIGWVSTEVLATSDLSQINTLTVEDGRTPYYGPMQAFAFSSAGGTPVCGGSVQDGLLIQTPEGVARVTLLINELTIDFVSTGGGTTALVNNRPDGATGISMLEGAAYVHEGSTTQFVPPGAQLTIPVNGAGEPVLAMAQPVPNTSNAAVAHLYSGLDRQPQTVVWDATVRPDTNAVAAVPSPENPNPVLNNPNAVPAGDNPPVNAGSPDTPPVIVDSAPPPGGQNSGNNGGGNGNNGNGNGNNGNGNGNNGGGNGNGNNGNGNGNGGSNGGGNGNGNNGNGNGNGGSNGNGNNGGGNGNGNNGNGNGNGGSKK